MAIIARVNPGDIRPIGSLAQVRNRVEVSSRPVEGLADAVRGATDQALKVVQQTQQRNDLAAVMQARRELSDWEGSVFDPGNPNGITQFQGQRSLGANEKLMPDLDERISRISVRMTPSQKAQFAPVATSFRDSVQGRLTNYMTAEHEKFLRADRAASVSSLVNDATSIAVSGDFETGRARLGEALGMQRAADETDGASTNVIAFNQRSIMSGFLASVTDNYMATDPLKAQEFVNRYGGDLLPADRARVDRALAPLLKDARATSLANAAIQGGEFPDFTSYAGRSDGRPAPKVPPQVRGIIENAADKYGVPRNIALALAQKESNFNPKAVNPEALDDGDHATGLFQYRKTTADALGIDRTDPKQSADAAMKQLAEQAKAKGWDWAIAHHFAGPDEKQHGPRTRAYVEDVRAKARRFGGVEAPEPAYHESPAASLADALERVRREPDPFLRDEAERKVRQHFALRDLREAADNKARSERVVQAINANPGTPLAKLIDPSDYAQLAADGKLESLETYRTTIATKGFVEDDLVLVDTIKREAALNPEAFMARDLNALAPRLSTNTLSALLKMQADGKKDPSKQADWATEEGRLNTGLAMLGLDKSGDVAGKGSDANNAPRNLQRGQFRAAYQQALTTFVQQNGKKPTPEQADVLVRATARQFAERMAEERTGVYTAGAKYQLQISEADRAAVRNAYRDKYGSYPTDAWVTQFVARKNIKRMSNDN